MRVFLLRHGETTGDVEVRYGGDFDDHLSPKGKKQATELAGKLEDSEISTFFTSPKIRAIETTAILSKIIPAKVISVANIRERNQYGVMTGMIKADAKKEFPDEVEELEATNPYHHVQGSEEYFAFCKRVIDAFNEIVEEEFANETESIAFVTHGGPITVIFREILGFEISGIKDCALFELEYDGDGFEIVSAEDVDSIEAGLK
ncbi:MAG: histidine phosphatase family protein [archaeon]